MSFYLIGRLDPRWRPTCDCLTVRGRVFIVVLVVVLLFVGVLTGQGYDPPTALGVAAAAGAVAAELVRRMVRQQARPLTAGPDPSAGAR